MIPLNESYQKKPIMKTMMARDKTKMAANPNAQRIKSGMKAYVEPAPDTVKQSPSNAAVMGMMHRGR